MEPKELVIPSFLQETEEEIHERMRREAPPDINVDEGDIFYDATRPTAMEVAEMTEFKLVELLRLAFPQTSYGVHLEWLAELQGIEKRPPNKASGKLLFKGVEGTVIRRGLLVSTESDADFSAIEYQTTETKVIGAEGLVYVAAESVLAGSQGKVPASTINVLIEPVDGIVSVTNDTPFTGGVDLESDNSLRKRVIDDRQTPPLSGAKADYVRWAKEVPGVGHVIVIRGWNGPNTVKLVILDSAGLPANENIINAVQEHIDPVKGEGDGLAPIGSFVTVVSPPSRIIKITFKAYLKEGFKIDDVISPLRERLKQHFMSLSVGSKIIRKAVGAQIVQVQGIEDYDDLMINGESDNITLEPDEYPVLGDVIAA